MKKRLTGKAGGIGKVGGTGKVRPEPRQPMTSADESVREIGKVKGWLGGFLSKDKSPKDDSEDENEEGDDDLNDNDGFEEAKKSKGLSLMALINGKR